MEGIFMRVSFLKAELLYIFDQVVGGIPWIMTDFRCKYLFYSKYLVFSVVGMLMEISTITAHI